MQRPMSYRVLILCALLALPTPAFAVPQPPPSMDDALTRIGTYATQALAEQGAPGMMLAVTDRTHTLRLYPVGYANLDSKTPVTDATRFGRCLRSPETNVMRRNGTPSPATCPMK